MSHKISAQENQYGIVVAKETPEVWLPFLHILLLIILHG